MTVENAVLDCALDLLEEITHPGPVTACGRWPEAHRLVADDGTRTRGLCGATNLCGWCSRVVALENAEVLSLDAVKGDAPTLLLVLTTRKHGPEGLRASVRSREVVARSLERRWPTVRWCSVLEFQTGEGTRSGGLRRPHWNYVLKGVPAGDVEEVEDVAARVWCPRMDAEPQAQAARQLSEVGGLMRYLALHFHKPSQAPPAWFRGHRVTHSRASSRRPDGAYFAAGIAVAREEARMALRIRRHLHSAEAAGLVGEEALWWAEQRCADDLARLWQLVRLQPIPTAWGSDGRPTAWTDVDVPIGASS